MTTKQLIEKINTTWIVGDACDLMPEIIEKLRQLEDLQVLIHETWVTVNKQYDIVRLSTPR